LFLHRDEYESRFEKREDYPVILRKLENGLELLLSHREIENMSGVTELIDRMKQLLQSPPG
jgi:hypothetical protein